MGETNAVTSGSKQVWIVAGALLVGSVLLGPLVQIGSFLGPTGGILATFLSVFSIALFAIGSDRSSSVTARRPLGTGALIALGIWMTISSFVRGLATIPAAIETFLSFGYIDLLVQFVLAAIATTQIARAGTVPRPWNLAPLWVVAVTAASWVVQQIIVVAAGSNVSLFVPIIVILDGWVRVVGPVFLGSVAIALASRESAVAASVREQES